MDLAAIAGGRKSEGRNHKCSECLLRFRKLTGKGTNPDLERGGRCVGITGRASVVG